METTLKEMFMKLIEIDTLIVLGMLMIVGLMGKDVQLLIVGGLLAALKTRTEGGSNA